MNRRTFCTLLVFLLLNACAPTLTPVQEELLSKAMPMYEGQFSPIQVPFQLEYRPVTVKLAGHFAVHTSIRDKDEGFSGELYGRLRVSPKGDLLLWEFKLENAVLGEQKMTSSAPPLVQFRALRDRYGLTKEGELTITAMKAKSPEENLQVEELKALLLAQFKSLSAEVPTLPIQSGTPLLEIDMKPALQAFEKLWGSPRYSPPKEKIGYSPRGFGSLKGRKVIVAVLDEDFICVAKNERRYSFGMHGYALLDADTAQILESKMMTTVKSLYSFDSIEFRMLQRVSAEIME